MPSHVMNAARSMFGLLPRISPSRDWQQTRSDLFTVVQTETDRIFHAAAAVGLAFVGHEVLDSHPEEFDLFQIVEKEGRPILAGEDLELAVLSVAMVVVSGSEPPDDPESPDISEMQAHVDEMTVNPLGATFSCRGCGKSCESIRDSIGKFQNPAGPPAVLFRTIGVERMDFCSSACADAIAAQGGHTRS